MTYCATNRTVVYHLHRLLEDFLAAKSLHEKTDYDSDEWMISLSDMGNKRNELFDYYIRSVVYPRRDCPAVYYQRREHPQIRDSIENDIAIAVKHHDTGNDPSRAFREHRSKVEVEQRSLTDLNSIKKL